MAKKNAGLEDVVLGLNDPRTYYFSNLNLIRMGDSLKYDKLSYGESKLIEKLEVLKRGGVRYLYEISDPIDYFFNKKFWLETSAFFK